MYENFCYYNGLSIFYAAGVNAQDPLFIYFHILLASIGTKKANKQLLTYIIRVENIVKVMDENIHKTFVQWIKTTGSFPMSREFIQWFYKSICSYGWSYLYE